MTARDFHLVEEPFIPVLDAEGNYRHLSLREWWATAHQLSDIGGPTPFHRFALLRLLVAFTARALDVTDQSWSDVWDARRFPLDVFDEYLSMPEPNCGGAVSDRLWLFGDWPFMQNPHVAVEASRNVYLKPAGSLAVMRKSANQVRSAEYEENVVFTPAESVLELLRFQLYCLGGRNAACTSARTSWGITLSGTTARGSNLFNTIMLNHPFSDDLDPRDLPVWEKPMMAGHRYGSNGKSLAEIPFTGMIDALTTASRAVLLVRNDEGNVDSFWRDAFFKPASGEFLQEPHTNWKIVQEMVKPNGSPKDIWVELSNYLPAGETTGKHSAQVVTHVLQLAMDGTLTDEFVAWENTFYENNGQKITAERTDSLSVPVTLLRRPDTDLVLASAIKKCVTAIGAVSKELAFLYVNTRLKNGFRAPFVQQFSIELGRIASNTVADILSEADEETTLAVLGDEIRRQVHANMSVKVRDIIDSAPVECRCVNYDKVSLAWNELNKITKGMK